MVFLILNAICHFFLADDCQQMFLHPINVRCLLREYGSLEASPDTITAKVVEIVGHTVTEVNNISNFYVLSVVYSNQYGVQFLLFIVKYFLQLRIVIIFQDIRRRHRYLAHLPLTCEFSICELVLQPPIISKETLDSFAGWKLLCWNSVIKGVPLFVDVKMKCVFSFQMTWKKENV